MDNQNLQDAFEQTQQNYELIPQFINELLDSEVFCLGTQDQDKNFQFRMLQSADGDQAIPFFLSLDMIHSDVGEDAEYFKMNTRSLFSMTRGATLVLNPTAELAKEFSPEEVESILNMDGDEL